MAYDNTNTGSLFVNDKGDNDKRPDRKGSINVAGVDYWISGWLREGNGKKFLSLKVEPKNEAPLAQQMKPPISQATPVNRGATNNYIDPQDDIEF
jgi:hypothetical protein